MTKAEESYERVCGYPTVMFLVLWNLVRAGTESHALHHTPLYHGAFVQAPTVPVDTVYFCCFCADNAWLLLSVTAGDLKMLAQICWSSHSEVVGVLSYISRRGNWSIQGSFIQRSGAAGEGGECFPEFSSQHHWVLILNPSFLKASTVSSNFSSKKSRY